MTNFKSNTITPRERVLRSIEHKETDRLPRDFDAEEPLIKALCAHLNVSDVNTLRDYFKVDMQKIWVTYKCPYTDSRNIFGNLLENSINGVTRSVANQPLAAAGTVDEVEAYRWPDPHWVDLALIKQQVVEARKQRRFVVCSSWGSIFGETYRLMGIDNFMIALYEKPEVVRAIIRKLTNFFIGVDQRIFTTYNGLIDMALYGNDMGTQLSLLFSRDMFQEFFVSPLKELVANAKRFGLKVMMHSCGAVSELIPDIISCGFDALDPVQYTAKGMNPIILKTKYGSKITFHGGISAQMILPLGTRDEVYAHVREVCEIMKPGGGYIFTSDQAITTDTPVENVLAMYNAIDKFGY